MERNLRKKRHSKPGMSRLEEMIEAFLWSGWIVGERPVSAIIVAPPGAGKSSLLEIFDSDFSPFTSDATSREISRLLRDKKSATHMLIGDFMSVIRHKQSTTDLTINMLSQLSGDTLRTDAFTGDNMSRRMGIITAIPPDDMKNRKVRKALGEAGFASRFLVAEYSYAPQTIARIHQYIADGKYRHEVPTVTLRVGPPPREIKVSKTMAAEIKSLGLIVKRDPIGARAHHYMRTLAMSIAAREGDKCVKEKHIKRLAAMSEFFSQGGVTL